MNVLDTISNAPPAGSTHATIADLLAVLDELSIIDRQTAALGLLNRIDPDDIGPLRHMLLGILDVAIVDGVLSDLDVTAASMDRVPLHIKRLWQSRDEAEARILANMTRVQPAALAALFDGVTREAHAAGLH